MLWQCHDFSIDAESGDDIPAWWTWTSKLDTGEIGDKLGIRTNGAVITLLQCGQPMTGISSQVWGHRGVNLGSNYIVSSRLWYSIDRPHRKLSEVSPPSDIISMLVTSCARGSFLLDQMTNNPLWTGWIIFVPLDVVRKALQFLGWECRLPIQCIRWSTTLIMSVSGGSPIGEEPSCLTASARRRIACERCFKRKQKVCSTPEYGLASC